jgi:hypothetical protein
LPLALLSQKADETFLLLVHASVEEKGLLHEQGIVEGRVEYELSLGEAQGASGPDVAGNPGLGRMIVNNSNRQQKISSLKKVS